MAELHGGDETISLLHIINMIKSIQDTIYLVYLVKVLQTLDEVVHSVPDGLAGDILQHWQEHFESHPSVLLILLQRKHHYLCRKVCVKWFSMNILCCNDRRQ